jgi:hypothetical protein
MRKQLLLVCWFSTAAVASAQTYKPPISASDPGHDARESSMNIQVERTDSGQTAHLKVTLTVPPASRDVSAYERMFFYGWTVDANGHRRDFSICRKSAKCPEGFPIKNGPFAPGDRVIIETDLPRSFADAQGAHLHVGVGGKKYYPTQNLLTQK